MDQEKAEQEKLEQEKIRETLYNEALFDLRETFARALNFRRESWWAGFTTLSFAAFLYWQLGDLEPRLFSKILLPTSIGLLLISGFALIWVGAQLKLKVGATWDGRLNQAQDLSIYEFWENTMGAYLIPSKDIKGGFLGAISFNRSALHKVGRLQTYLLLLGGVGVLTGAINSIFHFLSG